MIVSADVPVVTIGVASYNNAKYILETLNSVYEQDYPSIQLIIVDDCSTDNSVEVIQHWIDNQIFFRKILFIKHQNNEGICRSANEILNNAEGKYYMVLGSDDILLREKISSQVKQLESLGVEYALSYSNVFMIDADGRPMEEKFHNEHFRMITGNAFIDILKQNFIQAPSALYRTSAVRELGGYDESLSFEDLDILLRLAKKYKICYNDFTNSKYRRMSSSISAKFSVVHLNSFLTLLEKNYGYSKEADCIIDQYIVKNSEIMYRENGLNISYWLNRKWHIDKKYKSLFVFIIYKFGFSYDVISNLSSFLNNFLTRKKS